MSERIMLVGTDQLIPAPGRDGAFTTVSGLVVEINPTPRPNGSYLAQVSCVKDHDPANTMSLVTLIRKFGDFFFANNFAYLNILDIAFEKIGAHIKEVDERFQSGERTGRFFELERDGFLFRAMPSSKDPTRTVVRIIISDRSSNFAGLSIILTVFTDYYGRRIYRAGKTDNGMVSFDTKSFSFCNVIEVFPAEYFLDERPISKLEYNQYQFEMRMDQTKHYNLSKKPSSQTVWLPDNRYRDWLSQLGYASQLRLLDLILKAHAHVMARKAEEVLV